MIKNRKSLSLALLILMVAFSELLVAQLERPKESIYKETTTAMWINTYGNVRISDHLFWVAQTHFRFVESPSAPFAGQMG